MRLFLWSHNCLTALIDFSKSILQQAKRLRRRRQPVVATISRSDQVTIGYSVWQRHIPREGIEMMKCMRRKLVGSRWHWADD